MNCDRIAPVYRWLEYAAFGGALQRCRTAFLMEARTARHTLILGDGDGRFVEALLRTGVEATVDVVDSSVEMLALTRRRIGNVENVRLSHADASTWNPTGQQRYDLIATHFFLDCFTDEGLAALIPRWAAWTSPDARWIISEFRQPASGPAAWHARIWLWTMYTFFRVLTGLRAHKLPHYADLLRANGFALEEEKIARGGLLTAQLWRRRAQGFSD